MVYYDKNGIVVRDLQQSDAQIITDEELAQGWEATVDKYEMRLRHQAEGKAIALAAEWNGSVAGYVSIAIAVMTMILCCIYRNIESRSRLQEVILHRKGRHGTHHAVLLTYVLFYDCPALFYAPFQQRSIQCWSSGSNTTFS